VPDSQGGWVSNGVVPRRIEEKLGLHGSPTCVMGFESAQAYLIGRQHRGLSQMFVMIQGMRLMVAIEGAGMSFGAEQTALKYAAERRQGGDPSRPAVPIASHPDIQRQLLTMASRVEVLRGLVYELAVRLDNERLSLEPAGQDIERSRQVTQWLLPIIKASCAEAGFEVPSEAMQVLGGAGYTREWPVEQWMRDARMMSIAEGSTGIQALDLLHRRLWRDNGAGLAAFIDSATREIEGAPVSLGAPALSAVAHLRECGNRLLALRGSPRSAEAGAVAFLQLAMLAATGWIAVRLAAGAVDDPIGRRLAAAARHWLGDIEARAGFFATQALAGEARLAGIEQL
jgi:hypothetical protein